MREIDGEQKKKTSSISNVIGFNSMIITLVLGVIAFFKSDWQWFWVMLAVIIGVFTVYLFLSNHFDSYIIVFEEHMKRRAQLLFMYLLIVLIIGVSILVTLWGIPKIMFAIRTSHQSKFESNLITNVANLKSEHYTDSIFSPYQSYLSVKYILVEHGNTEFIAKHSYTGNEKWFVYGRMKETGILSEKVATTKIMYPNQALRFPFVSGEENWKSNANLLQEYGYSIEKYVDAKRMPKAGDILLWDTIKDDNGDTVRYGQLAFIEKVLGDEVYVSESRLVIQEKGTDTPRLPEGLKYVLICEDVQSVSIDNKEVDIYGVKLYQKPNRNSEIVAELKKFDYMKVIDSSGPSREKCWIRTRINSQDSGQNIENALIEEDMCRMWYKLQDPEDESIVGWALLEDRNQPDEEMEDVHSIEHNFTGIGIYGHEPFMYDINDAYIIRTPTPERDTDFKTN